MSTMTYLQPHEGVIGTDRTDDWLLSLDDQAVAHREVIRALVGHLRTATLVGNPAPVVQRMYERISHPQPGDLVIEESTFYRPDPDVRLRSFGVLLLHRDEWWQTDDEWQAAVEEERRWYEEHDALGEYDPSSRPRDHAWYVQYGPHPGDVCRWTNCSFVVVPVADTFTVPAGQPDDTGATVFTRDSLLGSLADSGFSLRSSSGADEDAGESSNGPVD